MALFGVLSRHNGSNREEAMSRQSTARNTVGKALAPPESTTSQKLGGPYETLKEAFACVRRAIRNSRIQAVGITSLNHIRMKMQPDWRPLLHRDSFEKFMHWFTEPYDQNDRFEVRLEDVPEVSDHGNSVHPRMAVIICMKQGERLEDFTDIKEQ